MKTDNKWQHADEPETIGNANGIAQPFRFIPFRDLKPGKDISYLVKGLLPRTGLVVVWGPPKCGKSFWTFDLVLHVAFGWSYRSKKVVQGNVIYCAFEGAEGFNNRAEAFRQQKFTRVDENPDPPFELMPVTMILARDHVRFVAEIRARNVRPAIVVLDTLNRSIGGPEDDEHMGAYIRAGDAIREAFGCLVIIVHHCGVNTERPRGHTSLTGAVEEQIACKRDGQRRNVIVVKVEYMKDGAEGEEILSQLDVVQIGTDPDGDPIMSCIINPLEAKQRQERDEGRLPTAAKIALRSLDETVKAFGIGGSADDHVPADAKYVTLEHWRNHAYQSGISAGEERAKQVAFQRAVAVLLEKRLIAIWEPYVWHVNKPKKAAAEEANKANIDDFGKP
jgi:hypothetical protein